MKRSYIFFTIFVLFSVMVFPQGERRGGPGNFQSGTIRGKVIDALEQVPIEYANVVVFSKEDSSQITGGISNANGIFTLTRVRPGNHYLTVHFIGYEKEVINEVIINRQNINVDLGTIEIHPAAINLEDVVVEGNRSPITYEIDKKVINVDQQTTVISGNAADVLENVPSVTVDIEGNVSLRGSGSFTVLIDGRPTILDAQDALQQIPATSIENIEIITNPSAKYDPEGTAGIINIILKESQQGGLTGVINGNAGIRDKYGADLLFEFKSGDVKTMFNVDYNRRFYPGNRREERITTFQDNTNFLNSNGNYSRGRISFGLRGGFEFALSKNTFLNISGRYGEREHNSSGTLYFEEWSEANPDHDFYTSFDKGERGGNYYSVGSNLMHKFNNQGHQIIADFHYGQRNSDDTDFNEEIQNGNIISGKKTTESGPSKDFRTEIEYTLPFGEDHKFEAGYENDFDIDRENNELFDYDPQTNSYIEQTQFTNSTQYDRIEHSLFSLYQNMLGNLGYQFGIRGEYTYQNIELLKTNQVFNIDRWDLFPTTHFSYDFGEGNQLMASYTRRIDRPRSWYLEPFLTWSGPNSVRRGNPALQPEFIDSYEFGGQTLFGDISFSTELYYRMTHNKIERVRSVYSEEVTLHTIENVGQDYSLGTELMLNFGYEKMWNANLMGNIYNYKVKGKLLGEAFERESFNWSLRFNNVLRFWESTSFQINAGYHSPTVSAQGSREGFIMTDIGVRQEFFNRKLSLTLQVRDLLGTGKWEFESRGVDFYTYNYFSREAPMVMLNIRLNINNYKDERRRGGDNGGGGFDDEGGEF